MSNNEEDQRISIIEKTLEELRPMFKRDGGDCELVGVEGNQVSVRFSGACVGCHLASATLQGVQMRLVEKLGPSIRLVPIQVRR